MTLAIAVLEDANNLELDANAVTPIPTWPLTEPSLVAASTTPPSDTSQYGALNFSLWQDIGEEILVKSNINNWIACLPGTGSLARWQSGAIDCRMIKSITNVCPTLPVASWKFNYNTRGPSIRGSNYFYYCDGTTSSKAGKCNHS